MTESGAAMIDRVYAELQLDPSTAVRSAQGFTWWGRGLAQHIWTDPGTPPRIHIRSDMVSDLDAQGKAAEFLGLLGCQAALSGPMRDPRDRNRVVLASSTPLEGRSDTWLARYIAAVARLQLWEARYAAGFVISGFEVKANQSSHPTSKAPASAHRSATYVEDVVLPLGDTGSTWAGSGMLSALQDLRASSQCLLANGGRDTVVAEFACGPASSLLQMYASVQHPVLGSGMLVTLVLPAQVSKGFSAAHALHMNEREMSAPVAQRCFGSWCWQRVLAYASFYPNALMDMDLHRDIACSMAARAQWAAAEVASGPPSEPPTTAIERMLRRFGTG